MEQAMATTRSSSRANTNARNTIIQMLIDDHKKVKKAFRNFERMDVSSSPEECEEIVRQTCADLTVHANLEEELFYPAVRPVIKEEDLVDEAEVEHMSAKMLIEQLEQMTAQDEKFSATFKVLGEYIKHHLKEEENEMFTKLERTKVNWEALLAQMEARRSELEQQAPAQAADTLSAPEMAEDAENSDEEETEDEVGAQSVETEMVVPAEKAKSRGRASKSSTL
jgi:hemerythrin-like domain-containing protein